MANEFYITAGLPAQDSGVAIGTNAFYITAGLVANDLPVAGTAVPVFIERKSIFRGIERGML